MRGAQVLRVCIFAAYSADPEMQNRRSCAPRIACIKAQFRRSCAPRFARLWTCASRFSMKRLMRGAQVLRVCIFAAYSADPEMQNRRSCAPRFACIKGQSRRSCAPRFARLWTCVPALLHLALTHSLSTQLSALPKFASLDKAAPMPQA
jgi:hypothetical protein